MNFQAWPSIESFFNVVKYHAAKPEEFPCSGKISYQGKIKLHGTNSGIRFVNGEVSAQSRSQLITPTNDNMGFAKWVESTMDFWKSLASINPDMTIFGEFCGSGIMDSCAIQQIGKKIFAIFGIVVNDTTGSNMVVEPACINRILSAGTGNYPENLHVLPWYGETLEVNYSNRGEMQATVDKFNKEVEGVEKCDPWVKQVFGVDGIGEGIVYYPFIDGSVTDLKAFENFAWKAKGEKHKVVKTKEAVQIDPEVANSIDEFVTLFVTEPRLEQGLTAIGGSLETKNIGLFLKWICQDIQKESVAELTASNLTWQVVQKGIQAKAKAWFMDKNKAI